MTVTIDEGKGHFPTAPRDPKPVVDFILGCQPDTSAVTARDYKFDTSISREVLEN